MKNINPTAVLSTIALATLTGCATNKPLTQQVSEGFDNVKQRVTGAPAPAASAASAAAAPEKAEAKVGVVWDQKFLDKVTGNNVVKQTARSVAADFTSLNKEYIGVTITDSIRGSKAKPVTYSGQMIIESCAPTVEGTAARVGKTALEGLTTIVGNIGLKSALPNGGGMAGNIIRTEAGRATTTSTNEAKSQILSGANNLTAEQQPKCKAAMNIIAKEISLSAGNWVKEFAAANKGSKPVVTYTGSANLKDLQLGLNLNVK